MNSSERKLYDLTNLNELCSFDTAVVTQLVQTFIATTPKLFTELENGFVNQSVSEMNEANHQLKSAFALLQITAGNLLVKEIDKGIKNNTPNFDMLSKQIEQLSLVISTVILALKEEFIAV